MKQLIHALILGAFLIGATTSFKVADRMPASVTFSHQFGDLGELKAEGKTIHQARSQVSVECFERRMDRFERERGTLPDDEQADLIIEDCVNIK